MRDEPDPTTRLGRARLATASAFFTQGLVFISLTTRLPEVKDRWSVDETGLSLLLLMMVLLAGAGSVISERLSARHPSASVLRGGLVLMALAVPVLALAPTFPVFVAGLAAYGVALGVVDACGNMQAVAIEHLAGRPMLPSFHGAWTWGGVVGAAGTLALGDAGLRVVAVLAVVPLIASLGPLLPRVGDPVDPAVAVPWRPVLLVGVALVLFYMVDTAAATWGPTHLEETFGAPDRWVAMATLPYLVATGVMRTVGDGLVARHGPVRVLRAGALVAAGSLAIVVLAPTWQLTVVGFTLLGLGVAVIAPLSFSAAAAIADDPALAPAERRARVDAVIARFNQFNYVGALLGSVLTGLVGAGSLRVGFAVPMVLILGLVPLARAFRVGPSISRVNS
ncbi:MFS transporter [Nocardioides pacificus]